MRPATGEPWDTREHRGADARIEPVLTGDAGEPLLIGRTEPARSEKKKRVARQRDGHCRYPGCQIQSRTRRRPSGGAVPAGGNPVGHDRQAV